MSCNFPVVPVTREFQDELLEQLTTALHNGYRAPLLQLETGGGKTITAGEFSVRLSRQFQDKEGSLCLYLVHRRELVDQVCRTLDQFGLHDSVGVIQAGIQEKPWAPLQVASVQTLVNRISKYDWLNPRVLFIDEAHHARASTWERILNHYNRAFRIGLTATPARLDGKGLGEFFDILIQGPSTRWLIDHGYLCDIDIYKIPSNIDLSKLKKSCGDYSKKDLQSRSNPKFRADIVEAYLKYAVGRRTIHYAMSIDDSLEVVEKIKAMGVSAAHIDGKTPLGIRESIISDFSSGRITFLSNYEIVTEGFDCPECDAILLSRKTSSVVLLRQMIGRARRPKADGRKSVLADLVGNFDDHDHPDIQPEWSLEDGIIKEEKGIDLPPFKTCSECGFLYPRELSACPECGSTKPRKTAEDIKIELEALKAQKKEQNAMQRRARNREIFQTGGDEQKLRDLIAEYGYKPDVIHVWYKVYGESWDRLKRQNDHTWDWE